MAVDRSWRRSLEHGVSWRSRSREEIFFGQAEIAIDIGLAALRATIQNLSLNHQPESIDQINQFVSARRNRLHTGRVNTGKRTFQSPRPRRRPGHDSSAHPVLPNFISVAIRSAKTSEHLTGIASSVS
jgi:hypothetical protein